MGKLTLSSGCEEITMFSEDLPHVVCNLTSSKIKTDNILSKDVEERSWCLEVGGGGGDGPCFVGGGGGVGHCCQVQLADFQRRVVTHFGK